MSIHILSPEVIDQIAAGEVVERPAHMVKELVENSLDAGATEVEVEFSEGGRFVGVKDNGKGIAQAELSLALARHATSKISMSDDLWKLNTYGFRGEALASIASVSELTLTSRIGEASAFKIKSEFGQLSEVVETGADQGTQIQIENLFSNTPARLKFLKSNSAEGTQIKNILRALALAYPEVSFRVRSQGKLLFYWPSAKTRLQRAQQVLDKEPLYFNEYELEGMKAQVALAPPNVTTGNSKQIWLFAQDRYIQDRSLQTAVLEAYRSLLMHGEYPFCVAWVTCPPDQIDINIHPTKSQVKFLDNRNAFRVVQRAVRNLLEQAPWVSEASDSPETSLRAQRVERATLQAAAREQEKQQKTMSFSGDAFSKVNYAKKSGFQTGFDVEEALQSAGAEESRFKEESELDRFFSNPEANSSNNFTVAVPSENYVAAATEEESHTNKVSNWANLQVLGQAHETYIVTQSKKALVLIDQHAAHERVIYEKLMSRWKDGNIEVQNFLIPLTVDLEADLVEALISIKDDVERLGVSIEQLGPESIGVSAAPTILREVALVKSLSELAKSVADHGGGFALENTIGHVCATLACHSVVRAGQALSENEMKALLESMDEFPLSSFCPHGRPVFVEYPFTKVEKDFGRIV